MEAIVTCRLGVPHLHTLGVEWRYSHGICGQLSWYRDGKAGPAHDAATTMFHHIEWAQRDATSGVAAGVQMGDITNTQWKGGLLVF